MRLKNFLRLIVYGGAVLLMLWAFWLEPSSLRVVEHELSLQRWPAQQNGLRIAVISDIHAGAPYMGEAKLHRIVEETNAARPDLILLAGDYVIHHILGGRYIAPEITVRILSGLRAPLGVYAVLGNHDIEDDGVVRDAFTGSNIVLMDDQLRRINHGAHQFWLAGFAHFPQGQPNVARTLAGLNDAAPVIGFTHSPSLFTAQSMARANLMIAGHTHGGQGNFPFFGRWPLGWFPEPSPYEAGHYTVDTDVFVTTGIGTSGLPVRFRVPPEISILNLRARP